MEPCTKQDEFHVCKLILNKYGFKEMKEKGIGFWIFHQVLLLYMASEPLK